MNKHRRHDAFTANNERHLKLDGEKQHRSFIPFMLHPPLLTHKWNFIRLLNEKWRKMFLKNAIWFTVSLSNVNAIAPLLKQFSFHRFFLHC